jgi:hypothetical protein
MIDAKEKAGAENSGFRVVGHDAKVIDLRLIAPEGL